MSQSPLMDSLAENAAQLACNAIEIRLLREQIERLQRAAARARELAERMDALLEAPR